MSETHKYSIMADKTPLAGRVPLVGSVFSRTVIVMTLLAMVAALAGYPWFRSTIASAHGVNLQTGHERQQADGIVVLTGDRARIRTGLTLFQKGAADRILISGVNRHTSREAMFRAARVDESIFPCCVDIGHQADSTSGNAKEAAKWAADNGLNRLIIVTSDYHMPRSLLEFRSVMPTQELIPHAVNGVSAGNATSHQEHDFLRLSLKEYGKYLIARIRIMLSDSSRNSAFANASG